MKDLFNQAREVWIAGGWAMIPLAVNAFVLFLIGTHLWVRFRTRRFRRIPEEQWKRWIARPEEREGALGELIDFAVGADELAELSVRFNELHTTELAPIRRDLRFMKRAVTTAPLLGLLGTVTGMLATFHALSMGAGGEKTMDLVAGGISEALITTETGLVIALPGLVFQYHLARERDRYEAFLAHLETVCSQYLVVWRSVRLRAGVGVMTP